MEFYHIQPSEIERMDECDLFLLWHDIPRRQALNDIRWMSRMSSLYNDDQLMQVVHDLAQIAYPNDQSKKLGLIASLNAGKKNIKRT